MFGGWKCNCKFWRNCLHGIQQNGRSSTLSELEVRRANRLSTFNLNKVKEIYIRTHIYTAVYTIPDHFLFHITLHFRGIKNTISLKKRQTRTVFSETHFSPLSFFATRNWQFHLGDRNWLHGQRNWFRGGTVTSKVWFKYNQLWSAATGYVVKRLI